MAYNIIQLKELMDQEYDLSKLFSTFSSINEDVENFLLICWIKPHVLCIGVRIALTLKKSLSL